MKEIVKRYTNGEITVVWRPNLCIHSGNCFRGLPQVFKPRQHPWVTIEGAGSERIVAQVARCPSGALSIERGATAGAGEVAAESPQGPLHVAPADQLTPAALAALFTEVFTGYYVPMQMDEKGFESMVQMVDIDVPRSVVGYEGERPVTLGLLALRGTRAWVGGMGVVPAARGRGYGAGIMRVLVAKAREAGARTLDLEVLEQNAPAARLYASLGFAHVRHLDLWRRDPTETRGPAMEIAPLELPAALDLVDRWSVSPAPWQRERRTIERVTFALEAHGVKVNNEWAGALVHREATGTRSLIAFAAAPAQRDAVLEALLRHALAGAPGPAARLLNLPVGDPAEAVLARLGLEREHRQSEMRLAL